MKKTWTVLALVTLLVTPAMADTIWDEGVDGDLSDDETNPTPVVLVSPSDAIMGTIGGPSTTSPPDDFYDAFKITLAAGDTVSAIMLTNYIPTGGNTSSGFNVYITAGYVFVGSTTMTTGAIGTDMLAAAGVGPLVGPGEWTIGLREGIAGQQYELEIQSTVPVELMSFQVE